MGDLTESFNRSEFACNCGCGLDNINLQLVERLQLIRNALKEPLHINCGLRCSNYNMKVGGTPNSAHTKGFAADVACPNSSFRYRFLKQAFKLFTRLEVPNGAWVHVDLDPSLPQEVCFTK